MFYRGPGAPAKPGKPTIRVLMLADAVGAPDGVTRTEYQAGQCYDLPEDLAGCFFASGQADPAEAHEQHEERAEAAQERAAAPVATPEVAETPEPQKSRPRGRAGRGGA